MPAPRSTALVIVFNARIAEQASAGAGATMIQTILAQQFTSIVQNVGRLTVSVSGGGKAYSFSALNMERLMEDAMEAWRIWANDNTTDGLAAQLDQPIIKRGLIRF